MHPFYCFENYLAIHIDVFYTDPGLFVFFFNRFCSCSLSVFSFPSIKPKYFSLFFRSILHFDQFSLDVL